VGKKKFKRGENNRLLKERKLQKEKNIGSYTQEKQNP
jgi:hypothetical protein